MAMHIPLPDLDWYHLPGPLGLSDISYLRSQWTPVYILTILWALSILARHGTAWLAGPSPSRSTDRQSFSSDGRPDLRYGTGNRLPGSIGTGFVGSGAEETRQLLERQLDTEMRGERKKMRHWRDRFAKGNQIARTVLLMLLGACIFNSVPIRYTCVAPKHRGGEKSVPTWPLGTTPESFSHGLFPGMDTETIDYSEDTAFSEDFEETPMDVDCGDGGRERRPREPREPRDPRAPRLPRDPRKEVECYQCATNGITFSTMLLSWIFLAIAVLWWVMELIIVETYGVGITRTIMSVLSFPLVIAMFAIGIGRWRYFAVLNKDQCDLGI